MFTSLVSLVALTAVGCATPEAKTDRFQRELFHNAEFRVVFDAAAQSMTRVGQLQTRDSIAGLIRTRPTPIQVDSRGNEITRPLDAENRFQLRRRGELRVQSDGAEVYVLCQVVIEKNETQGVHTLNRNRGAYDQPTRTAAERDAAYTTAQNDIWTRVRRDRALERSILREIRAVIEPPAQPQP